MRRIKLHAKPKYLLLQLFVYSNDPYVLNKLYVRDTSLVAIYLPTPLLRQDMTQGQFLSGV